MTALVVVGFVLAYVVLIFVFGSVVYSLSVRVLGDTASVGAFKSWLKVMIIWPVVVPFCILAMPYSWYAEIYSKRERDTSKVTLAQRWAKFLDGTR